MVGKLINLQRNYFEFRKNINFFKLNKNLLKHPKDVIITRYSTKIIFSQKDFFFKIILNIKLLWYSFPEITL